MVALKPPKPKLSCVILAYNASRTISKCLGSLVEAAGILGMETQIVVVDNGSTDGSSKVLEDWADKESSIDLIKLDRNLGTTVSRNLALAQSTGELVLILDSDAYINGASLGKLVVEVDSNESIGILAPKLVFPDGRPQLSTDQFPTVGRKFERLLRLRHLERDLESGQTRKVDYAISACWMLRRSTLRLVGNFDEKIFYAPEDADYCLRVWKSGLEVIYNPGICVVHDAQERSRRLLPNKFTWLHIQGLAYYFWKHRYFLFPPGLRRAQSNNSFGNP